MLVEQIFFISLFLGICLNNIIQIIRLSIRYLYDGADQRTPYIISSFIFSTLLNLLSIQFLITGQTTTLFSFVVLFYYLVVMVLSTKHRLLGYKAVRFNRIAKIFLNAFFSVLSTVGILICVSNFKFLNFYIINKGDFINYIRIFNSSLTINYSSIIFIVFSIIILASTIINFIFDIVERRSFSNHIFNIINFLPLFFIVFFILYPIVSITNVMATFLLGIIYLIIPYIETNKECFSILRHSKGIDSRISSIRKILNSIKPNKELTSKQIYQLQYIKKIFSNDCQLEEICLPESILQRKKTKYLRSLLNEVNII